MASEWMQLICYGNEAEFVTLDVANSVLGTVIARYNEIIAHLDSDRDSFDPVSLGWPEGRVIVTDWGAGFMDAV